MSVPVTAPTSAAAARRVRHFGANFRELEQKFPGSYPRMLESGSGVFLFDDEGHRLLDAGNHLGACIVGHGREEIASAIADQVRKLEFASLDSGASHPYAVELAEALADRVPVSDPIFSFTSSGSEANEVAIKVARAFFRRRGQVGRTKILTRTGSYHGSSYGAMSATAIPGFRDLYAPLVPDFVELPQPFPGHCGLCAASGGCPGKCVDETAAVIEREGPDTIAAIVAEPISIPGAIKVPSDDYWPKLRELCDTYGILLVADEVVCGFGRTGRWFGVDHWDVAPDIMTMAKGLTSGYAPLGAVAVSRTVQDAFEDSPLAHLNTYAGHPLACAAALRTLEIIEDEGLVKRAAEAEQALREGLTEAARALPWHAEISVRGLIGSIEIEIPDGVDMEDEKTSLWDACYREGVLLRVTGAGTKMSVIFYPPLTVTEAELAEGLSALRRAIVSSTATAERLGEGVAR